MFEYIPINIMADDNVIGNIHNRVWKTGQEMCFSNTDDVPLIVNTIFCQHVQLGWKAINVYEQNFQYLSVTEGIIWVVIDTY